MNPILAIMKLKFLQTRQNWAMILMMIVSPILFTLMIGGMSGGGETGAILVYFHDQDQSQISQELVQNLDDSDLYQVQMMSQEEIAQQVEKKLIDAGYVIPAGFGELVEAGELAEIKIVQSPEQPPRQEIPVLLNSQILRIRSTQETTQLVFGVLQDGQAGTDSAEGTGADGANDIGNAGAGTDEAAARRKSLALRVEELMAEGWANPQFTSTYIPVNTEVGFVYDQKAQASMGYLIFFLMFTLTYSISDILTEKEHGTWSRLLSTPIRSSQILLGHFFGTIALGIVQVILLVGFGSLVMGVQWGRSPIGVMMILISLIFALTSIGLMISGLIKTRRQLGAVTPILVVSTSMLGGCMWPLEIVPDVMKTVALFIPQGQAMMGLTDLVMRGAGLEAAVAPTLALLAMGVVSFLVGLPRVQQKM